MNAPGPQTRLYAVLGHPIGHTLSPLMHNAAFAALGLDAVYLAFDVRPEQLMVALAGLAALGAGGVNLTVPLKEAAFRGLTDLDESARVLGAVNTVAIAGGALKGYNTDGTGFLCALEEAFGTSPAGQRVFVLGCGGAGRAVALTCALHGATGIVLADLDAARARQLSGEIEARAPGVAVQVCEATPVSWCQPAQSADLVVQATPVGMRRGEPSPLPAAGFRDGQMAFDLVYNVPETAFLQEARTRGGRTTNGLGMLLHQGAAAFSIWTGQPAPLAVMRQALERALYSSGC